MLEMMRRLFEYTAWTTPRVIASLEANDNRDALRPFAHLLVAEKVWLLRLHGEDTSSIDLAPELTLGECRALAEENRAGYAAFLSGLSEDKLDVVVTYRNSKGLEFRTPVREILIHVAMHGAYHRGQVAAKIRADGGTPVNTDYITFTREVAGVR